MMMRLRFPLMIPSSQLQRSVQFSVIALAVSQPSHPHPPTPHMILYFWALPVLCSCSRPCLWKMSISRWSQRLFTKKHCVWSGKTRCNIDPWGKCIEMNTKLNTKTISTLKSILLQKSSLFEFFFLLTGLTYLNVSVTKITLPSYTVWGRHSRSVLAQTKYAKRAHCQQSNWIIVVLLNSQIIFLGPFVRWNPSHILYGDR